MTNKLKWYHWAARELTCWWRGHKTRTTWRKRPNYKTLVEMEYTDIPYADRCAGQNPYFYHMASWHHKCVRCRTRWCEWPRDSWHVRQIQAIRGARASTFAYLFGLAESPEHRKWAVILIPSYFLATFFVLRDGWSWPADMMYAFIGLFDRD